MEHVEKSVHAAIETYDKPHELEAIFEEISKSAKARRKKRTPKQFTKQRLGKGGKNFTYVDRRYVEQWLDDNFPIWSFEALHDSVHVIGDHVHVAGTLTVVERSGVTRKFTSYGAKEAIPSNNKLVSHPYLKSAESDALKRCAAMLGCAADIYNATDIEQESVGNPEDVVWFAKQLSLIVESYPIEKIMNLPAQFTALAQGIITKQKLIENYEKLGINLSD